MRTVTIREFDRERSVPIPGLWRKDVDSKDLLILRQKGMTVKETAVRFGIVKSTVCHRLKQDFPSEYRELRVNQPCTTYYAQCARAHKLYQEQMNYVKVAEAIGCSHSTAIGRVKCMDSILQEIESPV